MKRNYRLLVLISNEWLMKNKIAVALPKGRLAEETIDLFVKKGICKTGVVDFQSRKLIFEDEDAGVSFLLIRNSDIPIYVEYGAADMGVVGKDILIESGCGVYEFMDLGFGYCRLCSAGLKDVGAYRQGMKVATKYPGLTKKFFAERGLSVEVIKLYGSIELAPVAGLSDIIVDLVSSGETLRKNGLAEIETIMESTARLIANRSMTRSKHTKIKEILNMLGSI